MTPIGKRKRLPKVHTTENDLQEMKKNLLQPLNKSLRNAILEKFEEDERLEDPSERVRYVWEGVARFVNADLNRDKEAFNVLLKVIRQLMPPPAWQLKPPGYFAYDLKTQTKTPHDFALDDTFISEAARFQLPLHGLLRWICRPKSDSDLRLDVLVFLNRMSATESERVDLDEDPTAAMTVAEEEKGDFSWPHFFIQSAEYGFVVTPVCKFIFDQLRDGPRTIPIGLCKRDNCGHFFVPLRTGRRQYCSNRCRALAHQKDTVQQADYRWVLRLEQLADGLLHRKLKQRKNRDRLKMIEGKWGWAKEKVKQLKAR